MDEIEEVEKAVISVQEKTYWEHFLFFYSEAKHK